MLPLLHQFCDKGLHLPKLHLCPRSFFISSVMTCLLWFAAWLSLNFFFISSVMKVSTSQSSSPVAVGPATFGRLNDLHLYRSGVGFSGLYCSCFKVLCCGTFAWTMIKYSAKLRSEQLYMYYTFCQTVLIGLLQDPMPVPAVREAAPTSVYLAQVMSRNVPVQTACLYNQEV